MEMNIKETLRLNGLYTKGEECGVRANLSGANLRYADLGGANLRYADLRGANLRYAGIWSTIGNNREIKNIIHLPRYLVSYTKDIVCIGCEGHTLNKWFNFTDEEIAVMGTGTLPWWNEHKVEIKSIIERNPVL